MAGSKGFPSPNVLAAQYATPTTGQTITVAAGIRVLFINPAGTIATLTVVLPANPVVGQDFVLASSQIVTALTVTGTIIGTLTALAVGGFARFTYSSTAAAWFRTG